MQQGTWIKSSHSGGNDSCVEVFKANDNEYRVRDSKLGDASPVLTFNRGEWTAFLAGVGDGELS